jgi:hypothetical protein
LDASARAQVAERMEERRARLARWQALPFWRKIFSNP